jgi:hypothetical protein
MNRRKTILMLVAGLLAFCIGFLSTQGTAPAEAPVVSARAVQNVDRLQPVSPQ